jgi:hypothetical protein
MSIGLAKALSGFCLAESRFNDFGVVMEQSEPDCKGNVGRRGSPDNGRRR